MHLSCGFSGFSAEVCCVMKLGKLGVHHLGALIRESGACDPLPRRSAWLCFPTPRLPPSLQVRSYTSGSSRHRFSPIEVCSQAVEPARRRQPLRPPLGPALPSYHARRRTVRTPPVQLRAIRPIALRSLPHAPTPPFRLPRAARTSADGAVRTALVFFTSRAAAAVPRAAAHSPPSLRHATAARPRFRSSPRPTASRCHPAVPSASRGRSIAGLSRPRASRRRLRRPPPRVPPPPTAGAGDSAGGGRGEGRAWHRSTRRRTRTKMLKSGPSWQRGWQSTRAM